MLTLTAQARLLLGAWFPNHQPSWVKLTLSGATEPQTENYPSKAP